MLSWIFHILIFLPVYSQYADVDWQWEHCFNFQAVSDEMLVELKACFMEAYDDNQDGKIDIREVRNYILFSHRIYMWINSFKGPDSSLTTSASDNSIHKRI